ncbi:MAG: chitobiase/beta-hexosaminidase C-terminal domain-containing protein [Rubrobacteraceae bacterium]
MKTQASMVSTEQTTWQFGIRMFILLLTVLLWSAAFASPAEAKLSQVGPADPNTQLPLWIEDESGLRLQPCFARDRCLPLSGPGQDVLGGGDARQYASYWSASATTPTNEGGSAVLRLTTRGSFRTTEGSKVYAQQVSSKIHIAVDNLESGETYRVTHPYGTEVFTNVDGGRRGIEFTEEIGCLQAPCDDFSAALNGRVGPWLTPGEPGSSPTGHIGDVSTPRKTVGSPVIDEDGRPQNYFEIEGPNVGGPGVDVVKTDLFSIGGKISGLTAFAHPRDGNYDERQRVTLTASNPNGEIFYTTDGTEPSANSATYKKPISITEKTTLKYIVVVPNDSAGNRLRSPVMTETYTITGTDSD